MYASRYFDRIFPRTAGSAAELLFIEPASLAEDADSPDAAAWQLLMGSMALRRAGEVSAANEWLNHATRAGLRDDIFRAELLTEAGIGLVGQERLADALSLLDSAESIWRDVGRDALAAVAAGDPDDAVEFATVLLTLIDAAGVEPPVDRDTILSGVAASWLVRMWLDERAVTRRAESSAALTRVLVQAGRLQEAGWICDDALEWTATNFTQPAQPLSGIPLEQRSMSGTVREAFYLLLLALGEIELGAGRFQSSADAFDRAAGVYDGNAMDVGDLSRLLRAKFNQANSLLRLARYDDAMQIYELVEHGFNSIGDGAAAQRVEHAKLFVMSQLEDA